MAHFVQLPKQRITDINDNPISGARVFVYQAGTVTLLPLWQDSALSIEISNPVVADAFGEIPPFYVDNVDLADYKVTVTDSAGVELYTFDNLPTSPLKGEQIARLIYPQTEAEISASVTPSDFAYPEGDARRYGAIGDGIADDTDALDQWARAANGAIWLSAGKTYMVDSVTFPVNRTLVYGYGATLKYRPTSTADQVALLSGSDCAIHDLIVDANKSLLAGADGDGHTGKGYGLKITGDRAFVAACRVKNTPKTTVETNSAGFQVHGIDCLFESCEAEGVEYNGFRSQMDQNAQVAGQPVGSFTLRNCRVKGRRGWTNNHNAAVITLDNFHWDPAGHLSPSSAFNCETATGTTVAEFNFINSSIALDAGTQIGKSVSAQVVNYRNCRLVNLHDADQSTDCLRAQFDAISSSTPKLITIDGCYLQAQAQGTGSVRAVVALETSCADHVVISNSTLSLPDGDYIVHVGTEFIGKLDLTNVSFTGAPAIGLVRLSSTSADFPRVTVRGGRANVSTVVPIFATSGTTPDVGVLAVEDFAIEAGVNALGNSTTISSLVQVGGGPLGARHFLSYNTSNSFGVGWKVGDVRWNPAIAAGGSMGVICTTAGDGGGAAVFKAMANVAA